MSLDHSHYSTILYGTSLCSSILSSALARQGQRILHLDPRSSYGSELSSLNFNEFRSFLRSNRAKQPDYLEWQISEQEINQWKQYAQQLGIGKSDNSDGTEAKDQEIGFIKPVWRSAFGEAEEWIPEVKQILSQSTEPAKADKSSSDANADAAPVSAPSPAPVPPPALTVTDAERLSRRFALDLTPHLMFSRSPLIDLFISTNVANYLEFKGVDKNYFFTQKSGGGGGAAGAGAGAPASNTSNASSMASSSSSTSSSSASYSIDSIPLSRSAVFQCSWISLLEKRKLMKCIEFCVGTVKTTAEERAHVDSIIQQWQDKSIDQFLKEYHGLTDNLLHFLLYSIILTDSTPMADSSIEPMKTPVGIKRLREFFHSVGRYGSGAFLTPLYGISEFPQSFSRFSAIYGTTFMLHWRLNGLITCGQRCAGIVGEENIEQGEEKESFGRVNGDEKAREPIRVKCDHFVVEHECYLGKPVSQAGSFRVPNPIKSRYFHSVAILNAPVFPSLEPGLLVIPPSSIPGSLTCGSAVNPIRVLQYHSSTNVAPANWVVLLIETRVSLTESRSPRDYLLPIVEAMVQSAQSQPRSDSSSDNDSTSASSSQPPYLIYTGFYSRVEYSDSNSSSSTSSSAAAAASLKNIHFSPSAPYFFDSTVESAEQLYQQCQVERLPPTEEKKQNSASDGEDGKKEENMNQDQPEDVDHSAPPANLIEFHPLWTFQEALAVAKPKSHEEIDVEAIESALEGFGENEEKGNENQVPNAEQKGNDYSNWGQTETETEQAKEEAAGVAAAAADAEVADQELSASVPVPVSLLDSIVGVPSSSLSDSNASPNGDSNDNTSAPKISEMQAMLNSLDDLSF